jgi:hypothetical protein
MGRIAAAIILAAVAILHVVRMVRPDGQEGGSAARHAVFLVVNLALAGLLVFRPRWAFYPALLLTLQQLASHGLDLSRSFLGTSPLDWQSLAVCLFFPTLVTVLFIERNDEADE